MDTSWLSSTSSGVFNYLYKHITGEDDNVRPSSSLDVLSKANVWITDLPTNNYEPLEASHGARRPTKKGKRERELEEKIAVLKEQCDAKSQEIACLEEKVSQLREGEQKKESDFAKKMQDKEQEIKNAKKDILTTRINCLEKESEIKELSKELNSMKDKFAKCRQPDESLCCQVSELKSILMRREEINMKQKQLFRMLAADAQKRLDKASVDTRNLSEELENLEEREISLEMTNSSLKQQNKELQEKLENMINTQTAELAEIEKVLGEKSQQIVELTASNTELERQVKKKEEITTGHENCKEREKEFDKINSLKDQLKELQEKLGDTGSTQLTAEKAAIDKLVTTEQSQQSYHPSARNVELETEIKGDESVTTTFDTTKEQEKNLMTLTDSSLKHQVEEFQERLDDTSNFYEQKSGRVAAEQANISQQIVELQDQMSFSNATLQTLDAKEKEKEALLENSKEKNEKLEHACSSLNKTTSHVETADVSELPTDAVKTFNADDYFEAKSSPFDYFSANKEIGEKSNGLGNVFDDHKGGGHLKNQLPLSLAAVTSDAKSYSEQDVLVPRETETKKLKAGRCSVKSVNPFSKAALRGQGNRKPFVSMTNVAPAPVVHGLPTLRKRHETDRAEGFSSVGKTINPFSMSARDGSTPFQPRLLPLFPTAAQVAQTKKDDDWLPQNRAKDNLVLEVEEQGFLSRTFGKWFGF